MGLRVVTADHHPMYLMGLNSILASEGHFVEESCSGANEAVEAVRRRMPDIAIVNLHLENDSSGMEVARVINTEILPTRLILLVAQQKERETVEAMAAGIQGIITKEMAPEEILECIRTVHEGQTWLGRSTAIRAVEHLLKAQVFEKSLTRREIDLVRMVTRGHRNKEIADILCISEGTVKVHLHNIYKKLRVDGRIGLLQYWCSPVAHYHTMMW
ncbi:response regulator transcription factor [Geomonas sp. RF6]|uniref:LuxR C-terminal-related transcriptional regulator n=1 Tax=Geomonas sp. RF6 TaxID=2897342 RepID=UPI001E3F8BED|nr:response regulator transcription factor [Geomonas sp. RF6]UFS71379.1 response regulator transcription factor [Geomonas sp. RF6]